MYLIQIYYTLEEIIREVSKKYHNQLITKTNFFIYKTLDDLMPVTDLDFNNYNDIITDYYGRPGYLIYRDKFIFFNLGISPTIP